MLKKLLIAGALMIAGTTAGAAATSAVAVSNVNLRAGPSTAYPVVTVVPAGITITTFGCISGYSWCDIGFGPYRGWVAANYIQVLYRGAPVVLTAPIAPTVGITVVTFNRVYWDRYYTAYPWYGRWAAYPPPRVTSHSQAVNCAGGTCTGARSTTGIRGGSTAQVRSCSDGSCTATRVSEGPYGGTSARTRDCTAGQGCSANRSAVGPRGATFNGGYSFQR